MDALHKDIDSYIQKIEGGNAVTDDEVKAMISALAKHEWSSSPEIEHFDNSIQKIRKPLVEELGELVNEMPNTELYDSDPQGYINDINRGRFARLGFDVHKCVYKRTHTWDWQRVEVGILVPKSLKWTENVGVHVKWHGGGFGSSSWEFEPWFGGYYLRHAAANNAIILAPNYRLMPEASGKDIMEDADDFWKWFSGGSSSPRSLASAIQEIRPGAGIDYGRLLISGDSAGAFLAVHSWLTYPGKIRALYLTYPMLNYYHWPATKDKGPDYETEYRKCPITIGWANASLDKIKTRIEELDKKNQLPQVTKRAPPDGCPGNTKLGITGRWKEFFQRNDGTLDIPGRLGVMGGSTLPKTLPTIFIHHGHDDPQCCISDTKAFLEKLQHWYSEHSGSSIHFYEVKEIASKPNAKEQVGHGYDHDLDEANEKWLGDMLDDITKVWRPIESP